MSWSDPYPCITAYSRYLVCWTYYPGSATSSRSKTPSPDSLARYFPDAFPSFSSDDHDGDTRFGFGQKQYTGLLTASSAKRLRKRIQLLIDQAVPEQRFNWNTGKFYTFRINFVTLTLSADQAEHSDKKIKSKCLRSFLRYCSKHHGLKSYVWRAELQKNGNIHFHLITDTWIHYRDIRHAWNLAQSKLDLIDRFEDKHRHRDPNSTDVHAVRSIDDLAAYMVKYMTKADEKDESIVGRLWDCSRNLKNTIAPFRITSPELMDMYGQLLYSRDLEMIELDYCTILKLPGHIEKSNVPDQIKTHYREYIDSVRGATSQSSLPV